MSLTALAFITATCGAISEDDNAGNSLAFNDESAITAAPNWQLLGIGPEGENLLIQTTPSRCEESEEVRVTEVDGSVDIRVAITRLPNEDPCVQGATSNHHRVTIEQPLGDRDLLGCGREDCRSTVSRNPSIDVGSLEAASNAVGVLDLTGLRGYDSTGLLVSETSPAGERTKLVALDDSTAVYTDNESNAIAIDLLTGEELWRSDSEVIDANDDRVYLCGTEEGQGLRALDSDTGTIIWETSNSCRLISSNEDLLTVVDLSPLETVGGAVVLSIDATSGELVTVEPISADLQRLLNEQILEGAADDVAVFTRYNTAVGYDLGTQTELPRIEIDPDNIRADFDRSTVSVEGDAIWLLDRQGATISKVDPETGGTLWTTPIPLTSEFDAAVAGDTTYILTFQALIALDNETGEILWSEFRSPFR